MLVNDIVKRVNQELAGEQLVYTRIKPFLDEVIDDINANLNSTFPTMIISLHFFIWLEIILIRFLKNIRVTVQVLSDLS